MFSIKNLVNICFNIFKSFQQMKFPTFLTLKSLLLKNENIGILIFIIAFIFFDRKSSRQLKSRFDRTRAPNYIWRVIAVMAYLPSVYIFMYPCILFIAHRLPLSSTQDILFYDITTAISDFFSFSTTMEYYFNLRYSFIALCQLFLYYVYRLWIRLIPRKILYLPMFIRYHFTLTGCYSFFFHYTDMFYMWIAGIKEKEAPVLILNEYGRRMVDISEVTTRSESFAITCSLFMLIFYIIVIGESVLKAIRGISFTNEKGAFDIFVRTHLSVDSLYKNEKWSDFGIDDLDDYQDFIK